MIITIIARVKHMKFKDCSLRGPPLFDWIKFKYSQWIIIDVSLRNLISVFDLQLKFFLHLLVGYRHFKWVGIDLTAARVKDCFDMIFLHFDPIVTQGVLHIRKAYFCTFCAVFIVAFKPEKLFMEAFVNS